MERRDAYRICASWDGNHFVLYLRSLLSGVIDSPQEIWEPGYQTRTTVLTLPDGQRTVSTYLLTPREFTEELLSQERPFSWSAEAEWAHSVLVWLLTLFAHQAWYPEVRSDGLKLRLLTDSVEAQRAQRALREAMPPSFRAAAPQLSPDSLFPDVLENLADALGWRLLEEAPIHLRGALLQRLPSAYSQLLEQFIAGQASTNGNVTFFDPRQANLTLPDRNSHLAFAITAPKDPEDRWELRPALQDSSDPEQSCDALLAWQQPETVPAHFLRNEVSPRLHLLREFGRALRVFPDLGASLAHSPPSPLRYDTEQMAHFLKTRAETLRAYGYPLIASPELRQAQVPEVTLRIDPEAERQGLDVEALLTFEWNLAVDETLLDAEALAAWAESPGPLLFSQGRWFWVDPRSTMKALKFLQKQPKMGTLLEAMALAGGSQPLRLELAGQLSPLHSRQRFEERNEPSGFEGTLRAYQRRGFSWLLFMRRLGLGACLADDMGLGKTVQTLAALLALLEQGQLQRALLVCPTSVLGNWLAEAKRFAPTLPVLLFHGQRTKDPEQFAREIQDYRLVLTSYPLLTRDRKLFLPAEWDLVILDEAQQIKNAQTQSAKVARELQTQGRILLTGTPVENRLEDLWSLFRFLQPELLESRRGFINRFVKPIESFADPQAKEHLRRLVGPFILRRVKTDPLIAPELPAKLESVTTCSLTPEQAKMYEREVQTSLSALRGSEGSARRGAILGLLGRLKQLCNHPALLEDKQPDWSESRSGKIHRLQELYAELPPDEGILIFSQYARMVVALRNLLTHLWDQEILAFDGSTPRHQRDQMVERFQSGRGPKVFVISLKSGGVGLNLTRASTVVHFDRWWNPAVENQATDRAFRIGQDRPVQVFKFSTQGTLEEQIDRILAEKSSLANGLIEDGDSWLSQLGDQELSQFLLPGREASR